MEIGLDWVVFKNGLATVLCRSFDHVMCSKGEGLWAQENRRISQRCGADRVDQRAFAASGFGRSGGRLIDLEQVGERAPRHGCGLSRGSRVGAGE